MNSHIERDDPTSLFFGLNKAQRAMLGGTLELAEEIRKWPDENLAELDKQHEKDRRHKNAASVGNEWLASWHTKERYFINLAHVYLSIHTEHTVILGTGDITLLQNGLEALKEAEDIRFIIMRALAVEPREHIPPWLQKNMPPIVTHGLQQLQEMRRKRGYDFGAGEIAPSRSKVRPYDWQHNPRGRGR